MAYDLQHALWLTRTPNSCTRHMRILPVAAPLGCARYLGDHLARCSGGSRGRMRQNDVNSAFRQPAALSRCRSRGPARQHGDDHRSVPGCRSPRQQGVDFFRYATLALSTRSPPKELFPCGSRPAWISAPPGPASVSSSASGRREPVLAGTALQRGGARDLYFSMTSAFVKPMLKWSRTAASFVLVVVFCCLRVS